MTQHSDTYFSIAQTVTSEFKDRGSRFIAGLFPVRDSNAFQLQLDDLRSGHHKANHHCFAFRLRDENNFRYFDDGEPSGTAGKPIFNQLESHDLKDIACVVIRYFGGTKLGTSGLINAYRTATKMAIEEAETVQHFITLPLTIRFDYSIMGPLMDAVKLLDAEIAEKRFGLEPEMDLNIRASLYDDFKKSILSHLLGRSIEDIAAELKSRHPEQFNSSDEAIDRVRHVLSRYGTKAD